MMPAPSAARSASKSTPGSLSGMLVGCAARLRGHDLGDEDAFLADHDRLLRLRRRVVHPYAVERRRHDRRRIRRRESMRRARHEDHRVRIRRVRRIRLLEAADRPRRQHSTRAVPQRERRAEAAARRRLEISANLIRSRSSLRRARHARRARDRLRVLDVRPRVDDRDRTAELRMIERPDDGHDAAIGHLARADELHGAVVRARQMALGAVKQLELRAVGIHLI